MVNVNSTSRLSGIINTIILTQTDTTVGFLSQNEIKLAHIKSRDINKPFIKVYTSFKMLNNNRIRIPNKYKNFVRRSKKSSFIVKTESFRVAKHKTNSSILRDLTWSYSTSANESNKHFSRNFCEQKADIIIENKDGLFENNASKLYKINNKKRERLR